MGTGCPGQGLSPIPGGVSKATLMWHLGTWVTAGGEVGADGLQGLFQSILFCHQSSSPLNFCCSRHEIPPSLEPAWLCSMVLQFHGCDCLGTAFRAVLKLTLNRNENSVVFEDKLCCQPWARDSSDAGPVLGALGKKSLLRCCQCLDLWLGAVKHALCLTFCVILDTVCCMLCFY